MAISFISRSGHPQIFSNLLEAGFLKKLEAMDLNPLSISGKRLKLEI